MENKIVCEDDKKIDMMPINNNSSFKTSIIEGGGSESSLKTISSQPKEITISSNSSINPVAKSNNSFNTSDEKINKINNKNDNSSFSNNNNNQFNNMNNKDLAVSTIINNTDLCASKAELSALVKELNKGNENNNLSNALYQDISNNNSNEKITNNIMDDNDEKNIQNNHDEKKEENLDTNKELKKEVKQMINEGYIPFFMKAKGYTPYFFYGQPNSKFRTVIEQYIKKVNGFDKIKPTFYYNKKLIDLDCTIGELNLEPCSVISNEIQ
jgi:hypothetical protein